MMGYRNRRKALIRHRMQVLSPFSAAAYQDGENDRQYNEHDLVGDPCSYNKSQMVTENIPWSVSIFISP